MPPPTTARSHSDGGVAAAFDILRGDGCYAPPLGPGYGAGRTSISARFQRSAVGAVSLIVTVVPAVEVGEFCRWVQKVSPLGLRNWSTIVWLEPTVRAVALSQSSPTPQTQEPARVVMREAEGAPLAADAGPDRAAGGRDPPRRTPPR